MKEARVFLVGDSPGIYVCAIYLFTANIPITVIRQASSLEYGCRYVAGLPRITKAEFDERCMQQAKDMGISVLDGAGCSIACRDGVFFIRNGESEHEADYVVLDQELPDLEGQENVFTIESFVQVREAIDVAGAGCKAAFKLKELLL
ncbi:hypothetical protein PAPHI01_0103 [Pancytospora philotis]|nr:hypothetical protein PAPHI01_0103 [Pancytospora philotis]